jgi:FMN-dependent NADH-azoreductase
MRPSLPKILNGKSYKGLLQTEILFLLLSRGGQGYYAGERNEHMDFQGKYLKMVFAIMGVETIHEFAINGTNRKDDKFSTELEKIKLIYTPLE